MTRVHQRPRQGAHGSSALDRTRAVRKKKPYKVVMEVVTQEKKKLRSVMTYQANAPPGYTFVPLGNRDLTEYCKEKSRNQNLDVHIVSAKPKGKAPADPDAQNAPRIDTQRIGHHFPNAIVERACDVLGYTIRGGQFHKMTRNYEETQLARSLNDYGQRMRLHGRPATETQTKDQIRGAILEVFPKVPERDLDAIVHHAFEEGTNRVGNAKDLTLARRVQLAVGAYIRHQYTDYDNILKTGGSWPEARQKAQPISYAKLREWRDEGESNGELEETFREIIVLDDDEDNDSDTSEDTSLDADEREHSLEIVSSRATARELLYDDYAGIARPDAHSVSRNPRRMIFLRPMNRVPSSTLAGPSHAHITPQVVRAPARTVIADPLGHPRAYDPYPARPPAEPLSRAANAQQYIRDQSGKLYSLQPIEEPRGPPAVEYSPSSRPAPRQHQNGYAQSHARVNSLDHYDRNRIAPLPPSRRPSGDDVILPSIEREPEPLTSPRRIETTQPPHRYDALSTSAMLQDEIHSPKRKAFPAPVHDMRVPYYNQPYKRPRPVRYEEIPSSSSSHSSMFQRSHEARDPIYQPRLRALPDGEVIDLTSSPNRPSGREGEVYVVPTRSYPAAPPSSHSFVPAPEYHRTAERSTFPRYEYADRPASRSTALAEGGRYTRNGVHYDAHGLP